MKPRSINTITTVLVVIAALGIGASAAWAQCQISFGNGYGSYCSDNGGCAQYGGGGYTWGSTCTNTWCNSHQLSCPPPWLFSQTSCCTLGCYNPFCAGCKHC